MDNQESCGLVIQIQILAHEIPHGEKICIGGCLLRVVCVVAKCLDITGDGSFNGQHPFEGSTRAASTVVIDCQHALPQIERSPGAMPRAKTVVSDGHGAHKSLQAISVFLTACRKAKPMVRQIIPETKTVVRRSGEILNAHPYFTYRGQEPVNRLRPFFG